MNDQRCYGLPNPSPLHISSPAPVYRIMLGYNTARQQLYVLHGMLTSSQGLWSP